MDPYEAKKLKYYSELNSFATSNYSDRMRSALQPKLEWLLSMSDLVAGINDIHSSSKHNFRAFDHMHM